MTFRVGDRNLLLWLKGPKTNLTHFRLKKSKYCDLTERMDIHFADNAGEKLWFIP